MLDWKALLLGPTADLPSCSPYAVHTHPPQNASPPQGAPGALLPNTPGPTEALSVSQINEEYIRKEQNVRDRLEAESRGYESVFSQ